MSIAILHEGKKIDKEFFKTLIAHLKLENSKVSYYPFGPKSNFYKVEHKKYKDLIEEVKSERIKKVLFILDADNKKDDSTYGGYENTTNELKTIIKNLNIKHISDFYITKKPNECYGNLESLILSTITSEQSDCIETFLGCSSFKSKENSKAILNKIYKLAYPTTPYDLEHKNFNELKEKLKYLFE